MKRLSLLCLLALLLLGPGCGRRPTSYEGRLYYTVQEVGRYHIEWTDSEATAVHHLLGEQEEARGPAVSSDGLYLAYQRSSPPRVHVLSLVTQKDEQVSTTAETVSRPSWSFVGKRLAYLRYTERGKVQLLVQAVGGAANVIYEALNLGVPTWSRLGNRVFYAEVDAAGGSSIYSRKVDGTEPELVLEGGSQPSMSPDGSALAVVLQDKLQVYDMLSKQVALVVDAPGITSPSWSPSGKQLCYVRQSQIWTVDLAQREPRQITSSDRPILDVSWGRGL